LLKVLYLVPNLGDAAVQRRVAILRDGGARVTLAGFQRAGAADPEPGSVVLGRTFDARFSQRILAIARASGGVRRRLRGVDADVIIARNLEMLFLARRLRPAGPAGPPLVYECLDVHRLLLRDDVIGRHLRRLEQSLVAQVALVMTSSPAFTREYFAKVWANGPPILLLENKVYGDDSPRGTNPVLTSGGDRRIRLGWFGALRCRRSLAALLGLAEQRPDTVDVVLRGRPALHEFDDFHTDVESLPNVQFAGPYRNPHDLNDIYSSIHLAWAIDFFEAGKNSDWLLPNRIYEGCLHGAIPVALKGTETAAFLDRHQIGIVLPDIERATLTTMIDHLDDGTLKRLAAKVAALPRPTFALDAADCGTLVEHLTNVGQARPELRTAA